jgi:undecaprenyl-diphosphatase
VVPVSSSAQLTLLPWLLQWDGPADRTGFAAGLHAGSALGIAAAVRPRPRELPRAMLATVPAALVGTLAQGAVERRLGGPGPTAVLLAGAGIVLLLADRAPQSRPAERRDVLLAGGAQIAALAPGVSRSGITISALRLRGVTREEALRTSLVLSLPVTLGAAALTARRSRSAPAPLPTALAAVSAYITARRVRGVSAGFLSGSALYRLAVAGAVGARLRKEKQA